MRRTSLALGAVAAALLAPVSARADIFAAVTVAAPGGRGDFDVAVLNASTGTRAALPAGTNTTDDEIHPTISKDGRRLAFERRNLAAGTVRTVVVDRSTGHSGDLFNGFEAAQRPPGEPAISPDGSKVVVGGPLTQRDSISYFADLISTDLAAFPAGPYAHTTLRPQYAVQLVGTVDDPVVGGDGLMAYAINDVNQQLVLMQPDGTASMPQGHLPTSDANPAIAADHPTLVAFDQRMLQPDLQSFSNGDIVFRPATVAGFVGTPTALPAIVNTGLDERQPALTPDERYLAFVRDGRGSHASLFVWDSQTQTLLNPVGVDLGAGADGNRDVGSVSLFTKPIVKTTSLGLGGLVTVDLIGPSGIGIIVQRILGTHRVLGRQGYKLGPAKCVPLGTFKKGRHGIRWDLRVNGHKLPAGRYLVTVRAVTPKVVVRELGRSHVIRVR
jgi:WD40-like Beta Propeller Repeat